MVTYLKERYYEVVGLLTKIKTDKKVFVFEFEHERKRKELLKKLFDRSYRSKT